MPLLTSNDLYQSSRARQQLPGRQMDTIVSTNHTNAIVPNAEIDLPSDIAISRSTARTSQPKRIFF